MLHCDVQIVMAGMTDRDIDWQEAVLDKILEETGGWKASLTEEPEVEKWNQVYMIRLGHKNLNLVFGGGYDGSFGLMRGTLDFGASVVAEAAEFKRKWEDEHDTIAKVGGDSMMCMAQGMVGGGGGCINWECFVHFDPYDEKSTRGACEFFDACARKSKESNWGPDMGRGNAMSRGSDGYHLPKEEHEKMLSAGNPLPFNYQWKLKQVFNPNDLGDQYWLSVEPNEK
jgi:hypothetical protein